MTGAEPETTLLVVQPSPFGPAARLGEWLAAAGARLETVRPYAGERVPTGASGWAGVVCLGGEMGAMDDAAPLAGRCPRAPGGCGAPRCPGARGVPRGPAPGRR